MHSRLCSEPVGSKASALFSKWSVGHRFLCAGGKRTASIIERRFAEYLYDYLGTVDYLARWLR